MTTTPIFVRQDDATVLEGETTHDGQCEFVQTFPGFGDEEFDVECDEPATVSMNLRATYDGATWTDWYCEAHAQFIRDEQSEGYLTVMTETQIEG